MNNLNFNTFLYGEYYPIIKWEETENINFWIEQTKKEVNCPNCNCCCTKVHEVHKRKIQDTPIHNKNVYININVREFVCENKDCKTKTFTENLPFAGKHQVRTHALSEFIVTHAIYMSSNSTSLILSFIGVDVSADTVDNILKNIHIQDNLNVERIGIDDVAIRKGLKYATAIYDLDTHHLIALLEGREKEDIIPWLEKHKNIKFVARDRASSYAEAINQVLPNAVQIADRYHLFENIIKYLKDKFYSEIPDKIVIKNNEILDKKATKVKKELANIDANILNNLNYTNDVPINKNGQPINFIDLEYDLNDKEHIIQAENRLKKYDTAIKIRKDYTDNKIIKISELADKYNISKNMVKKYLKMTNENVEQIKVKKNYKRKETEFSKYKNIAYKMLVDGISLEYIIAYLLKCGYSKGILSLKGKIYSLARNNGIDGIKFIRYVEEEYPDDETVITRKELLKYLLTIDKVKEKNKEISDYIAIIEEKYSMINEIKTAFKDFHDTIFSKDENKIDDFIKNYQHMLPSFCNGIKKDITAVKNAISSEINSGFVEGNNNKFKLIKRIVYGKQKICNLFKRSYLAFTSTLDDLSLLRLAIAPLINK